MSNLNPDVPTPGPWKIEADPQHQGKHPYHDYRFVTATDENGHRVTICKMMDSVHQKPDAILISSAQTMRSDLEEGIAATQSVIDAWEKGDLAGAVNNLQAWMLQARKHIDEVSQ